MGLTIGDTVYGEVIGHLGGLAGNDSTMYYFPDSKVTFVLFANRRMNNYFDALSDFKQFSNDNPRPQIYRLIFEE